VEYFFIALVIVITLAVIAYPLFTAPRAKSLSAPPRALDDLLAQRTATYDAIRDLDFDFSLGKLSQADYDSLREKYKLRAAQLLQQIDAAGGSDGAQLDEQIEAQVARMRRAQPDDIERAVARLRAQKNKPASRRAAKNNHADGYCAKCGTPRHANDKFCRKCGNKIA